jgi:uncharacterized damage-inducible protein DinB
MIGLGTIRECLRYTAWARDKLLARAAALADAQLDQPFPMGTGSLRATLQHLYGAERTWFVRWQGSEQPQFPHSHTLAAPGDLWLAYRALATARDDVLATLHDDDLERPITYITQAGQTCTNSLGDILLHVSNHGTHHRAQAGWMLRQLGSPLPKPGPDYIFMRLEDPALAPPALDVGTLRTYYAYADWARDRVHAVAAQLTGEQLDRPFDLGIGSARATLAHICLAEQWWLDNWTVGPKQLFPASDSRISVADLARQFEQIALRRNELLAGSSDADLHRPVGAMPRQGMTLSFPLGVTMLQLCCHGTHHRAQLLNMFRRLEARVPELSYITMARERCSA